MQAATAGAGQDLELAGVAVAAAQQQPMWSGFMAVVDSRQLDGKLNSPRVPSAREVCGEGLYCSTKDRRLFPLCR